MSLGLEKMKKAIAIIFVISFLLSAIPFAVATPESANIDIAEGQYVPKEIIVKFNPGVSEQQINDLNLRHGSVKLHQSSLTETYVLQVPNGKTVPGLLKQIREEAIVEYAQPNYVCNAFSVPNDPLYSYQWNFQMIGMDPTGFHYQGPALRTPNSAPYQCFVTQYSCFASNISSPEQYSATISLRVLADPRQIGTGNLMNSPSNIYFDPLTGGVRKK